MVLLDDKRVEIPGLYVGAAVLFWLAYDEKPRVGLIWRIRDKETDMVAIGKDKERAWSGVYPRLDLMAISPVDDTTGEPVGVAAAPHEADVRFQLSLEGAPETFITSCPRYTFVKRLEGSA